MHRLILASALALAGALTAQGKVLHARQPTSVDPMLALSTDSVDFRPTLTRVYGKLTGRPHTSGRIDSASLLNGKSTLAATDIDGVDMGRYFQWEDDGVIAVEIDFPATPAASRLTVILATPKGESVTTVKLK